jgi:hypothetical protein
MRYTENTKYRWLFLCSEDSSARVLSRTEELRKEQGQKMLRYRNYWIYSASLAIVWAVVLLLTLTIGSRERVQTILLVFLGFCIGWVSTTIARYVYPPPKRWGLNPRQE